MTGSNENELHSNSPTHAWSPPLAPPLPWRRWTERGGTTTTKGSKHLQDKKGQLGRTHADLPDSHLLLTLLVPGLPASRGVPDESAPPQRHRGGHPTQDCRGRHRGQRRKVHFTPS